jgi:prepilin-type N-terminal cleavage/methylation domain-containing protein
MISKPNSAGFTLTELAVVLVIVALLIGGMMMPLGAQDDLRRTAETQKTLADIQEALIGFAAANGRLPCPASSASNGVESPSPVGGVGACASPYDGFVPAVTLGLSSVNENGYAIDAWNNPIRYAVFPQNIAGAANRFTTANGMRDATMAAIASTNPLLSVCSSGSAVTSPGSPGAACTSAGKLTDSAVAVIYSLGKNAATGGTGPGERNNPNPNATIAADPAFVSHTPTAAGAADGEFDDIVIWLSPNILFSRMIAARQLP